MTEAVYKRQLASNRRARHEYHIHDEIEAGIQLTGTEVKAARSGKIQLRDGYVEFKDNQAFLCGVHISPYSHGNRENHALVRPRKLLMHRRQIDRLAGRSQAKGFTVVPLKMYLLGNRVKVEVGLAQGKKLYDKRATAKERELDREAREAVKAASRY
ncbi:MAG: SsrA-binding protein SmpB [Acidobacteriota bacterium]